MQSIGIKNIKLIYNVVKAQNVEVLKQPSLYSSLCFFSACVISCTFRWPKSNNTMIPMLDASPTQNAHLSNHLGDVFEDWEVRNTQTPDTKKVVLLTNLIPRLSTMISIKARKRSPTSPRESVGPSMPQHRERRWQPG